MPSEGLYSNWIAAASELKSRMQLERAHWRHSMPNATAVDRQSLIDLASEILAAIQADEMVVAST